MRHLIPLLLATSVAAAEQTDGPAKQGSTPVLFLGIGASSSNEAVRKIGFGLPQNGWYNSGVDNNLDAWASEFERRGLPFRVMLHNPWGTQPNEVMDFDQAIEANQNPNLTLVCQTFVPWLESRLRPKLGTDGECIIYLGSGRRDADLVELKDNPAAYLQRLNDSVREIPDWCTLAFDDAANLVVGDPFADFMALQAKLRRIYVEPRPNASGAIADCMYPVISDARLFRRTDPAIFPDARHMVPNAKCGDEIMRLMVSGSEATRRQVLQQVVNDGHTVLFSYNDFWALDLTPERTSE